jgi:hypothetical protein
LGVSHVVGQGGEGSVHWHKDGCHKPGVIESGCTERRAFELGPTCAQLVECSMQSMVRTTFYKKLEAILCRIHALGVS